MFSFKTLSIVKATTALLFFWQAAAASTFAQSTVVAATHPVSAGSNNNFVLGLTLTSLSLGLCGSLFWWKREKSATATRPPSDRHLRPTLSEDKKLRGTNGKLNQPRSESADVDARFAAWVQSNINNKPAVESVNSNDSSQRAAISVAAVPNFELPAALPPLEPLPFSDAAQLLEIIEQSQDFNADETTREIAVLELSGYKTSNSVEALTQIALYDECSRLRINAVQALDEFDHESTFEPILLACTDVAREVRAAAARSLSRLNFERSAAFNRIVESGDRERLRLSAMACIDAGLVGYAFNRLLHEDRRQSTEAFAMIRLLVAAENYQPIIYAINNNPNLSVRLATIQALKTLKPADAMGELQVLLGNDKQPREVAEALNELFADAQTV